MQKEKAFDQTGVTVVSESANAKRKGNSIGLWLGWKNTEDNTPHPLPQEKNIFKITQIKNKKKSKVDPGREDDFYFPVLYVSPCW